MGTLLDKHRVPGLDSAFYIPNFVTVEEEEYLIRKIIDSPQQKWKHLANRRLQLLGGEVTKDVLLPQDIPPFLTEYPNIIGRLQDTGAFESSPHGAPNHIILNEYLPGQGIMPHEDGPSYYPVVATISLSSHAIFHYYEYARKVAPSTSADGPPQTGRTINPTPVLSVLLEPRSAIVTKSSLYTSHLHGIEEIWEDTFVKSPDGQPLVTGLDVPVANWHMLTGDNVVDAVMSGGKLKRGTRYSLTCRDVGRVMSAKNFLLR